MIWPKYYQALFIQTKLYTSNWMGWQISGFLHPFRGFLPFCHKLEQIFVGLGTIIVSESGNDFFPFRGSFVDF